MWLTVVLLSTDCATRSPLASCLPISGRAIPLVPAVTFVSSSVAIAQATRHRWLMSNWLIAQWISARTKTATIKQDSNEKSRFYGFFYGKNLVVHDGPALQCRRT